MTGWKCRILWYVNVRIHKNCHWTKSWHNASVCSMQQQHLKHPEVPMRANGGTATIRLVHHIQRECDSVATYITFKWPAIKVLAICCWPKMARVILWSSAYDPYSNNSEKIYKRQMIKAKVIYVQAFYIKKIQITKSLCIWRNFEVLLY